MACETHHAGDTRREQFHGGLGGWWNCCYETCRKFKLQDKYNGIVIHDKEDGDEPYDEVRKICAIVWDRGTRMFKANTELLRSSNPADVMRDVSSNQPYNINSTLHDIIKAAKLVPEGAAQTSIKLVAAPGAAVNPPGAVGAR